MKKMGRFSLISEGDLASKWILGRNLNKFFRFKLGKWIETIWGEGE